MNVLVTGGAGFIGSHLVEGLLARGDQVSVLDNFDPYYEPARKRANIAAVEGRIRLVEGDLRTPGDLSRALEGIEVVAHLAARPGVRPSIEDPVSYVDNNVRGTQCLLEAMRERGIGRMVYASSSSVYGARTDGPFREDDPVARPVSPYAATKLAGELLCHAAAQTWGLQVNCMRLFTVYGPRQRPEMAIHLFARKGLAQAPIPRFGSGQSRRDYTFVSDIVAGLTSALERLDGFAVYNLGNGSPVTLDELLGLLEEVLGVSLDVAPEPDQPGDVPTTWADVALAADKLGYAPQVSLRQGLERFRDWLLAGEGAGC
jgi:UDP-glucuronate 4-epimerase